MFKVECFYHPSPPPCCCFFFHPRSITTITMAGSIRNNISTSSTQNTTKIIEPEIKLFQDRAQIWECCCSQPSCNWVNLPTLHWLLHTLHTCFSQDTMIRRASSFRDRFKMVGSRSVEEDRIQETQEQFLASDIRSSTLRRSFRKMKKAVQ